MIRRSLRLQIALFAVLGIAVCFSVGFIVAVLFPTPEPRRISIEETTQALRAQQVPPGWRRSVASRKPFVTESGRDNLIRSAVAADLAAPRDTVEVRSLASTGRPAAPVAIAVMSEGSASGRPTLTLSRPGVQPGARFSPFAAAWRSVDGSWRIVEPATPFFTPARLRMLAALALAAALILPVALWGAARLTAPFRRLEAAAADDSRLDSAAWVAGPSEARSAASAMDAMRQRLLDHLRTRTAMMAAIAHDLRTPLTGLRLRVEGLTGVAKAEAVADIARMERMIAQLLTYVRGEEVPWVGEPVDLVDVIEDALGLHRLAGSPVSLETKGEHLVMADREHLDRALSNLIDNAVIYGGGAKIAVRANHGVTICTIDDDGPGIAPEELESVFEPFHRLERSRNRNTGGAGLGLAIVASILRRAGGEIDLRNRPEGGLRAEVRLPALCVG